jgi:hypothetical protein
LSTVGDDVLDPQEEDMTEAPALRIVEADSTSRSFDDVDTVEIIAPDRSSAALLRNYAAPLFLGEIVRGPGWIVRFDSPPAGGDWVVELLALVERWLKSVPLPRPTAHEDGGAIHLRSVS